MENVAYIYQAVTPADWSWH